MPGVQSAADDLGGPGDAEEARLGQGPLPKVTTVLRAWELFVERGA